MRVRPREFLILGTGLGSSQGLRGAPDMGVDMLDLHRMGENRAVPSHGGTEMGLLQ